MLGNSHVRFGEGQLETQVTLCAGCLLYLVLFSDSKRQLWDWKHAIKERLISLRLTVHDNQAQVSQTKEGISWLGWRVYPTHKRLKRRNVVAFRRRFKRNLALYAQGEITFAELDASVQGWINHAEFGDTWQLRENVLGRRIVSPPAEC